MHTLQVIAAGFVLLGACLLLARLRGARLASGAIIFIPLWLIAALANMWIGVRHGGYAFWLELPIACVVFAVPAAVAIVVWRAVSRTTDGGRP